MKMSSEISLTRARCAAARIPVALALVCAFALAGCGGGGGSSRSTASTDNFEITPRLFMELREGVEDAATATPRPGSVTQSSNTDPSGLTLDEISAEADYDGSGNLRISITNRRSGSRGSISTEDGDTVLIDKSPPAGVTGMTGTVYQSRVLGKAYSDGIAIVGVYTDRMNAADTDYLVGGTWVFIPVGATVDDIEFGAFADGPDTNLTPAAYLVTAAPAARYTGDAVGLYTGRDNDGEFAGDFQSLVALTANFGPSPTIEGEVTSFYVQELDDEDFRRLPDSPTLNLERTSISNNLGGFFTGDTLGTLTDDDGMTVHTYEGKWGGQFYGSEADSVAGTFGGHTSGNPRDPRYRATFVGAFSAQKE